MHILLKCEESSNFTIGLLPFLSVISESNKKPVAKKENRSNLKEIGSCNVTM